jgi:hypothetical protein
MSETENRSVSNLVVLCLEHASEVDDHRRLDTFTVGLLRDWKQRQLDESDAAGKGCELADEDVALVYHIDHLDATTSIIDSNVVLGGEPGRAPGAGGGGGGAVGTGAVGGDGGAGGDVIFASFLAEDLPDELQIRVGAGGEGGQDGEDGQDGGDTIIEGLLRARGGKGGLSGDSKVARQEVGIERVSLSSFMLADFVQVREGLAFVVGGGWRSYDATRSGGVISGAILMVFETAGGDTVGTCRLTIAFRDPAGDVVCDGWANVDLAATQDTCRIALTCRFGFEARKSGTWTVVVRAQDGTAILEHDLQVLTKPAS